MSKLQTLFLPHAIYQAGRDRKCFHDTRNHKIEQHEVVLQLKVGQFKTKGYCAFCAQEMIAQAKTQLEFMEKQLTDAASSEEAYKDRFVKFQYGRRPTNDPTH